MFVSVNFPMKELHRRRDITIYLPDDYYEQERRYPVLYINDGQNAFFDETSYCGVSWGFLEYVQEKQLNIIMVAIPCNEEGFKRMDEYGPWVIREDLSLQETQSVDLIIGGEGIQYVKWIMDELKPFVDKSYLTDKEDCAIVGSSMGGVISAYAALEYPGIFKKCAALSTAYWFYMDEFKDVISRHEYSSDFKFYFDLGEFEGCGNDEIDLWYKETNDEIYGLLEGKIENLEYCYFEGASHNEENWRRRVPIFMEFFYQED